MGVDVDGIRKLSTEKTGDQANTPKPISLNDLTKRLQEKDFYPYKYEKMFQPPSFTIKELHDAIPQHLFGRSTLRSSLHILANILGVIMLFVLATNIDTLPHYLCCAAWPVYWWFQGMAAFGLWILGHELGHNSLSDHRLLNHTVGFILHTFVLTPFYNWKISHALHHTATGHMDRDQNYVPLSKAEMKIGEKEHSPLIEALKTTGIYHLGILLFMFVVVWPAHLFILFRSGRAYRGIKEASLIWPSSPVFRAKDRRKVMISNAGILFVLVALVTITYYTSIWTVFKYYWGAYLCSNAWLISVTFLQHTDIYLPHYSNKSWTFTRGTLATVDRDYGWFLNNVLHHVGDSHVAHHICPHMPFYNAIKATPYLKEKLGEYYFYDQTPIYKALFRVVSRCCYVDDKGDVLFYRSLK